MSLSVDAELVLAFLERGGDEMRLSDKRWDRAYSELRRAGLIVSTVRRGPPPEVARPLTAAERAAKYRSAKRVTPSVTAVTQNVTAVTQNVTPERDGVTPSVTENVTNVTAERHGAVTNSRDAASRSARASDLNSGTSEENFLSLSESLGDLVAGAREARRLFVTAYAAEWKRVTRTSWIPSSHAQYLDEMGRWLFENYPDPKACAAFVTRLVAAIFATPRYKPLKWALRFVLQDGPGEVVNAVSGSSAEPDDFSNVPSVEERFHG